MSVTPMHFVAPPLAALLAGWLAMGETHIWRARMETRTAAWDASCLSEAEGRRAARLRMPGHREAFVFAHAIQRHVLSCYTGIPAADLMFAVEEHGKPVLGNIQFNLSHCGDAVLFAVSGLNPVGIDLENCERKIDIGSLVEASLNADERVWFERLPVEVQPAALLQAWTRKEAVLKAQGCGLSRDPRELTVSGNGPVSSVAPSWSRERWMIVDLALGERWRAAVSMPNRLSRLRGFCLGW